MEKKSYTLKLMCCTFYRFYFFRNFPVDLFMFEEITTKMITFNCQLDEISDF